MRLLASVVACLAILLSTSCRAYGPDGHHTIGAIADRLIAGTNAETRVRALLAPLSLEQAAVWADCAKGVS